MTLQEALRHIKSHGFAARVGIASDLRTFLRAAQQEEAVNTLVACLVSKENQLKVLCEALELSAVSVDSRYQNPHDAALGILVWALSRMAPESARVAAQGAVDAPQCWWAWKVGDSTLAGTDASRGSGDASVSRHLTYDSKDISVDQTMLRGTVLRACDAAAGIQLYDFSLRVDPAESKVGWDVTPGPYQCYLAMAGSDSGLTEERIPL